MSFKCIFREEEFTYFRPLAHHIKSGWSEDFTLKVWKIIVKSYKRKISPINVSLKRKMSFKSEHMKVLL